MSTHDKKRTKDENRDPISGAKGAHPLGAGVGAAAGGAATGAAVGSVAGPLGTAAGVLVGGLVGGYVGKGVAEKIDPTEEHKYWRNEYRDRDYVDIDDDVDADDYYDRRYGPAYQYGWESFGREYDNNSKSPRRFEDVEQDIARDWEKYRGEDDLPWDQAKPAARDSYDRVYLIVTDDQDR